MSIARTVARQVLIHSTKTKTPSSIKGTKAHCSAIPPAFPAAPLIRGCCRTLDQRQPYCQAIIAIPLAWDESGQAYWTPNRLSVGGFGVIFYWSFAPDSHRPQARSPNETSIHVSIIAILAMRMVELCQNTVRMSK